jgi:hypothetical protein
MMRKRPPNTGDGQLPDDHNHQLGSKSRIPVSQLPVWDRTKQCPLAKPMLSQIDLRIRVLATAFGPLQPLRECNA